jgi:hypothetical protein
MAEVGRELGQVSLDIDAVAIPMQECIDCRSVAKIMQSWPSAVASTA